MGQGKEHSLHEEINSFWNHLNFNIYTATVLERMHHLDLGLFSYMVKFTRDLLKVRGGNALIIKMDQRLGMIPRYPGLKIFNIGLADLVLLTASEYRHMMKVMPFVLEGLFTKSENELLVHMFVNWNKMYRYSIQCKFTQTDLLQFVKSIQTWAKNFIDILGSFTKNNCRFLKYHHWIHHTIETIKEYGNQNGLSADTYETLHKFYIKTPYRMSNKRDIDKQILQKVVRTITINDHIVSENYQSEIKKKFGQFGKKYCTIPLHLLRSLVEQYEHDEESVTEILEGLRHLAPAINDYFKLVPSMHEKNIEESEATLILYESFTLSNKEQLRVSKNFYNAPMFSDVAILMDSEQEFEVCDGYCFAKVLLLIRIIFKNTLTFNLALVRCITPPSSDNSQSGFLDIVEFVREKAQDLGSKSLQTR
ncbi:hypothetical protein C2G38_2202572 [Gigaspora rosea]|uniref:Uncharacterized protein n=1 Tax=Gigaspora rosea TaxID=44941 RepID=A0A397UW75_9GLOM|nr:hypothetical protein C2G38_2202572 [Gigaspora rosea]